MKVIIYDSFPNALELSYGLERIANLIEQGYLYGTDPTYEVKSEETDTEDETED
jgi:hypothetical protein